MHILGISCFYHDAAAALLRDGEIIAASQEERFTRRKHDPDFPINAIRFCLSHGGISPQDLDYIGFYEKPLLKFERILYTYIATFPWSFRSFSKSIPIWLHQKLWIPQIIRRELEYDGKILFVEHHQSHAASSFLVSPFKEAAILTIDGVGEWSTTTFGAGRDREINLLKEIKFPHSLGLLYSAFTYYLGFKVNSAEYKVMGLAPYGEPKYFDLILRELIHLNEDGSFKVNMKYFSYDYGLTMTDKRFEELFRHPRRRPETKLDKIHMDLASSIQKVTEEIILRMAGHLYKETGMRNLCMAGGVGLNCVSNGRILRETLFKDLFIQPAAGDSGGAVGVAIYIYNSILGKERKFIWKDAYLGPSYSHEEIKRYLLDHEIIFKEYERRDLLGVVAELIRDQNVVGWFQGRMEFGPRALGNRSILADPRNPDNWQRVNLKIKFRESFRPFAPSVLLEKVSEYFELDHPSPYMLLVAPVRKDKRIIPAVTHIDGSARIQTVSRDENGLFYDLIAEFEKLTGVPILINTSFNVRGEPIVCSPDDAYICFMRTDMDYLVMDNFIIDKKEMMPLKEDIDWKKKFELD